MTRTICAAIALACLVAEPALADEYANVHSVAIVSGIGNTLTFKKIGITVFENEAQNLPIADWSINSMVEQKVASALRGRFQVVAIPADVLAKARAALDSDTNSGALTELAEQPVDAIVLVREMLFGDQIGGTGEFIGGLGVYHRELLFGHSIDAIFAVYVVQAYDRKSGRRIDYGMSSVSESILGDFLGQNLPVKITDQTTWPDTPEALTDSQRAVIKADIVELIDASLPLAMKSANLVSDASAVAPLVPGSAAPAVESPPTAAPPSTSTAQ